MWRDLDLGMSPEVVTLGQGFFVEHVQDGVVEVVWVEGGDQVGLGDDVAAADVDKGDRVIWKWEKMA